MANLSGAEVLLATWSHGGLNAKKPVVKGDKIEYISCVGDLCSKLSFVPLATDGGRTFAPSAALALRFITMPIGVVFIIAMGCLTFINLVSTVPGDHLLSLVDNPFMTGAYSSLSAYPPATLMPPPAPPPAGKELAFWGALLLYGAHAAELLFAAAILLSPPLRAPVSSVLAWSPFIMAIGFPVTMKVVQLRSAELKAKAS